jgi:hypothetical protein
MHLIMLEMISLPEQYTVVYLPYQDLKANTFNFGWQRLLFQNTRD